MRPVIPATAAGGFPPSSLFKFRHRAEIRHFLSAISPRRWAFSSSNHGPRTVHEHFGIALAISIGRGLPRQLEHNDKSLQVQEG